MIDMHNIYPWGKMLSIPIQYTPLYVNALKKSLKMLNSLIPLIMKTRLSVKSHSRWHGEMI